MTTFQQGNTLSYSQQQEALRRFVHRFTGDHKPAWAKKPMPSGDEYAVQFKDDREWLAHTNFAVTKSGKLDNRVRHCMSNPTWPNGFNGNLS